MNNDSNNNPQSIIISDLIKNFPFTSQRHNQEKVLDQMLYQIANLRQFNFIHKIEFPDDGYIILSLDNAKHNIPALLKYASNVESVEYNIPTLNQSIAS